MIIVYVFGNGLYCVRKLAHDSPQNDKHLMMFRTNTANKDVFLFENLL